MFAVLFPVGEPSVDVSMFANCVMLSDGVVIAAGPVLGRLLLRLLPSVIPPVVVKIGIRAEWVIPRGSGSWPWSLAPDWLLSELGSKVSEVGMNGGWFWAPVGCWADSVDGNKSGLLVSDVDVSVDDFNGSEFIKVVLAISCEAFGITDDTVTGAKIWF